MVPEREISGELIADDCSCSTTSRIAIAFVAIVLAGIGLAVAIWGLPVTPTGVVAVRLDSPGPLPPGPGPGPGPQPSPFADLAGQIAAEARDVRSRNRAAECEALAAAIDRSIRGTNARDVEQLFQELRRASERAIPPRSPAAEAWEGFNKRFAEIFDRLFDSGVISGVASAIEALGEVVRGLKDSASRF